MAKVDKSQYTKAQWRIVREQRRRQKELDRAQKAQKKLEKQEDTGCGLTATLTVLSVSFNSNTKNFIVCLKHGTKYSSEYVNKLYNMVKRHCTIPHTLFRRRRLYKSK